MEIKKYIPRNNFFYFCLSCLFAFSYSVTLFSDTLTPIAKGVTIKSSKNITDTQKPIADIVIYKNSIVVRDETDSIITSENIRKAGDYKFSIDNLSEMRLAMAEKGPLIESTNELKVGKYKNGQYIFITGSIFIKFNDSVDSNFFAAEYNLIFKDQLSSGLFKTFKIQDIAGIEFIVDTLRNDSRVELVEYDFINPLIKGF
tara:strand:- start:1283 stop:1885 length:603 start_codon:yes stop_codon:yes gene_type:complete